MAVGFIKLAGKLVACVYSIRTSQSYLPRRTSPFVSQMRLRSFVTRLMHDATISAHPNVTDVGNNLLTKLSIVRVGDHNAYQFLGPAYITGLTRMLFFQVELN